MTICKGCTIYSDETSYLRDKVKELQMDIDRYEIRCDNYDKTVGEMHCINRELLIKNDMLTKRLEIAEAKYD
jgi:predicted RNase H-like nuclease (RuvC/YqgF family)